MGDKDYLIALSSFVPFGPKRLELLINYFGSAKEVWKASSDKLNEIGLPEKIVYLFDKHKNNFPKNYFERLKKQGVSFVAKFDSKYPEKLKDIDSAPFVLYYKGNLDVLNSVSVAIIGSRKMTTYGKEVAESFSRDLTLAGVTVVSGLARGIDTVAHRVCVENQGETVAVLGCGIDSVYPSENLKLSEEITKKGILISEYPLGYPALPVNFANRNRIISGLANVVLVVEGEEKSGTLLTAKHAAEQGRTVFAVPGQIFSPLSGATHFLIKNGASIAFEVRDVLADLDMEIKLDKVKLARIMPETEIEARLADILSNEPLHLDEVVRISSLESNEVIATLTMMELKGIVKNVGNGIYKRI